MGRFFFAHLWLGALPELRRKRIGGLGAAGRRAGAATPWGAQLARIRGASGPPRDNDCHAREPGQPARATFENTGQISTALICGGSVETGLWSSVDGRSANVRPNWKEQPTQPSLTGKVFRLWRTGGSI